ELRDMTQCRMDSVPHTPVVSSPKAEPKAVASAAQAGYDQNLVTECSGDDYDYPMRVLNAKGICERFKEPNNQYFAVIKQVRELSSGKQEQKWWIMCQKGGIMASGSVITTRNNVFPSELLKEVAHHKVPVQI